VPVLEDAVVDKPVVREEVTPIRTVASCHLVAGVFRNRSTRDLPRYPPVAAFSPMQSVGIKVLKNRLSEFVRAAAAGQTVLVTDRGQVVAELVQPRVRAEATSDEQRLGALHLATMGFLRSQGMNLALATYDLRLAAAAMDEGFVLADCP
jgi:antitoxin (DNA-binding transcriptional repressor) of toxin-antitoxin stability system